MGLKERMRAFFRSAAEEAVGRAAIDLDRNAASRAERSAVNLGRLLAAANAGRELPHLRDYGFRVFSQYGEDGVLQHLLGRVPIAVDRFVEIGVEDYTESNTRFLVEKDDWAGLIVDCDDAAAGFLRLTGLVLTRTVEFRRSFVSAENVDELLQGQPEDLGLLSLDIDGMEYWVWKALTAVRPRIVVVEYQNLFGPRAEIVVPYDPDFDRHRHHPSGLLYGASLAAFEALAREKGYALVGTSDGPNAFFVRNDCMAALRPVTSEACYREARYRESNVPQDDPAFLATAAARRRALADGVVLDLRTGERRRLGDVEGLA